MELAINDVVAKTRDITLAPGNEETVVFIVTRDFAASYRVDVAGLTGAFVVRARPAEFTVANLTIGPEEVYTGEEVTISVLVTNLGELAGMHQVVLKIDDVVEASDEVTLAGGASREVSFTVTRDIAATYGVDIAGLTGAFVAKAVPPPPPPVNWWLIVGIIAAVIVTGLVVFSVIRRRGAAWDEHRR